MVATTITSSPVSFRLRGVSSLPLTVSWALLCCSSFAVGAGEWLFLIILSQRHMTTNLNCELHLWLYTPVYNTAWTCFGFCLFCFLLFKIAWYRKIYMEKMDLHKVQCVLAFSVILLQIPSFHGLRWQRQMNRLIIVRTDRAGVLFCPSGLGGRGRGACLRLWERRGGAPFFLLFPFPRCFWSTTQVLHSTTQVFARHLNRFHKSD